MKKILTIVYSVYVIILFVVLLILSFPIVLLIICFPKSKQDKMMHTFLRAISSLWLYICFIKPQVLNAKLQGTQDTQIIIANHASYLDAPALYTCITVLFKTLGKEEIARIPIFKHMYKSAVITVNRGSTMARAKSFLQMQQELEDGLNVVFFPEGTFDQNQAVLKPFYDGAFHLAIKTQKNIAPLLLVDSHKRMQPNTVLGFSPGLLRTVFLPPISTVGLTLADTDKLKQYCHQYMNTILQFCKINEAKNYQAFINNYVTLHPFNAQ